MFARPLLAMIAMLPWSAVSCLAAGLEVGVYLRSDGAATAPVLEAMRAELDTVLDRAGFHLKWWHGPSAQRIEAEELIVVDLRGACLVPRVLPSRRTSALQLELASTSVVGSHILPFSSLECGTLNDLIADSVLRTASHQRDQIYGRALARVLAHEFYHVLAKTHKHTARGVAKRTHSASELTADHFDFDPIALSQLRQYSKTGPDNATEAPSEPVPSTPTDSVSRQ
jgi:hypothetical protein